MSMIYAFHEGDRWALRAQRAAVAAEAALALARAEEQRLAAEKEAMEAEAARLAAEQAAQLAAVELAECMESDDFELVSRPAFAHLRHSLMPLLCCCVNRLI